MAKIVFNNQKETQLSNENKTIEKVKVTEEKQINVSNEIGEDSLEKVKILKKDELRVTFGPPSPGPVYILGSEGPQGPTGPAGGGANYFYSMTAPTDAVTGDKWFHPGTGIEFTRVQNYWVQLYRAPIK